MMIEAMDSCSQAPRGPYNRIFRASIGAPQREKPSSPTSNARTDRSCQVPESGVRGNPPAPFGRGERPQGPTYPYTVRQYAAGKYHSTRNSYHKILGFKVLIRPSKPTVKRHIAQTTKITRKHKNSPQEAL